LARTIAITNQKGGVGKTTTSINLSASLAAADCRVLIVDCDPQANSTGGLGFPHDPERIGLYEVLVDQIPIETAILSTGFSGLDLLPSGRHLAGANVELVGQEGRETRLSRALEAVQDRYDFIFIDCPPALDQLTLNALIAANSVLIPIQCEYFALEGVSALMETIDQLKEGLNSALEIEGVLLTMFDERTSLTKQVASDLREFFGNTVFDTVIPRNIRLAEAPSHGKPVMEYDLRSKGADSYLRLAREVLDRMEARASGHTAY
jgi:chromosome partitioning protein